MSGSILKYSVVVVIAVFFAAMWGLLLREHLVTPPATGLMPDYGKLLGPDEQERRSDWDVYFAGRQVGSSQVRVTRSDSGAITIRSESELEIPLPLGGRTGAGGAVDLSFEAGVSPLFGLRSVEVNSDWLALHLFGTVKGEKMLLSGHLGERRIRSAVPCAGGGFAGDMLSPLAAVGRLDEGQLGRTWTASMVNPLLGRLQDVSVTVLSSTEVPLGGERTRCYRLIFAGGGSQWSSWVKEDGEVLVQGTPFGVVLRRRGLPATVLEQLQSQPADGAEAR